jgi:uncharacterized protein YjbI with pentapeptide repeats
MKLINTEADALSFGYIVNLTAKDHIQATFIAKASYQLEPSQITRPYADEPDLLCGDIEFKSDKGKGVYYSSDFAPFKPSTDILLQACAYSPDAKPTGSCQVGVKVGDVSKHLTVWGERVWLNTSGGEHEPSDPSPFTRMPIHYGNSYGGPGFDFNRDGKGHHENEPDAKQDIADHPVPNILEPNTLLSSMNQPIKPVGFGPHRYNAAVRMSMIGTYDDEWLQHRWPWVPDDFQWNFFNSAPYDQQVEGYLKGDESLKILNLHREYAQLNTRLPGERVRLFLEQADANSGRDFREVSMNLDTLWIDLEQDKVTLVWRGIAAVDSPKLKEVDHVYLTREPLAAPQQAVQQHASDMHEILTYSDKEDMDLDALEAKKTAAANARFTTSIAKMEQEFVNMNLEFDELRASSEKDEDTSLTPQQHRIVNSEQFLDDQNTTLANDTSHSHKPIQELPERSALQFDTETAIAAENATVVKAMAEMDHLVEEISEPDKQIWTAESLQAYLAVNRSLHDTNLDNLELVSVNFNGLDLSSCSLKNCVIKDTDLSNAILADTDFSNTRFERVNLNGAMLNDAQFEGSQFHTVNLQGATLDDTEFSNCTMEKTSLANCEGVYTTFSDTTMLNTDFSNCQLTRCGFTNVNLSHATFFNATLDQCSFSTSSLVEARFEKAIVTNSQFSASTHFDKVRITLTDCTNTQWEDCTCDGITISDSVFDHGRLEGCSLRQATLQANSLIDCDFNSSQIEDSILTNNNFLRASFDHATLQRVDFGTSNLYQSSFLFASMSEVDFRNANTTLALIRS